MLTTVVLVLSGCNKLQHDKGTVPNNCYVEKFDVSEYHNRTPKPRDNEHKNWIFAGWYTEENSNSNNGEMWAKFIPEDMLCVDYQVSENTTKSSETCDIILQALVDDASYKEVGFVIKWDGKEETFVAGQVLEENAKYYISATIEDVSNNLFSTGICVTPYIVTPDGTRVEGKGRYIRVEDTYLDVVNVPVHFYSDAEIKSENITVNYDADNFNYIGIDEGNICTEDFNTDTTIAGKIICTINENTIADGLFANFRFKLKDDVTLLYHDSLDLFTVTANEKWNCSYFVHTQIEPAIRIEMNEKEHKWLHNTDTGITGGHGGGTISYHGDILKIADCWALAVHELQFIDGGQEFTSGKTLRMQVKATPIGSDMNNLKLLFFNCDTTGSLADENLTRVVKDVGKQGEWVTIEMDLDMFLNSESKFPGMVIVTGGYNDWQSQEMYTFEISNVEIY